MSTSTSDAAEGTRMILRGWRYWIRPIVVLLYAAILLVALPLLVVDLVQDKAKPLTLAWFIAGIFVIVTIPISLWTILHHLIYFTQPELQKPIMRILWMVPIYAIDCWFAIKFPKLAIYFDTVRECYEAYVIYSFMVYLLNYLTREYELAGTLGNKPQRKHIFPFCCLPPWPMGGIFIQTCKRGVLQYTLIRPVTTIIALICELTNVYHEGDFSPRYAWLYIMIINNMSQIWAMYCLVLFYMATKEELKPISPVGKFVCVKMVVFASFWQGVAIAIVAEVVPLNKKWGWDTPQEFATGLQDLLICFEMFIAAVAHHYTFSYQPFVIVGHNIPWYRSIRSMFDVSDVRNDVTDHVKQVGNSVREARPPWKWRSNGISREVNEKTSLLLSPSSSDGEANVLGHQRSSNDFVSPEVLAPEEQNSDLKLKLEHCDLKVEKNSDSEN
uniref:Transmembrane protein 184C-like n=1 Tax=Ciona intestinalis TaxID=7719 RepID=F6ULQ2_CIOIN|nr:transmembrane protein 184C-like [Ciona intestinalis]|eukprot:XP_002127885.1 transmembrane protein 184C-like [Ciona intestinalis]